MHMPTAKGSAHTPLGPICAAGCEGGLLLFGLVYVSLDMFRLICFFLLFWAYLNLSLFVLLGPVWSCACQVLSWFV